MTITITPAASERMRHFLANTPAAAGVRFGVKRTGCSGFAYVVDLAETIDDGDQLVEIDGLPLIVNDKSLALVEGTVIDCRGLAARDKQSELRGVKGELILIETAEVELKRPVRLIHPRFPLYVIPRGDGRFMLGATSIETENRGVSVRSALELLGAAYAVHPAFGEARILEFGSGLRPAFPDNLPRIAVNNEKIAVNGLYRHGFLLAPALAELTLGYVERGTIDNEVMQCA